MTPAEIIWEYISSQFQEAEFWPAIVACAVIVFGAVSLLPRLKQQRYKLGAAIAAIGLVLAVANRLMKWNDRTAYLLAGALILSSLLLFVVPYLWNKYRFAKIYKLCQQMNFVEAWEHLNKIKAGWLTAGQLRDYQKRRFFLLVKLGSLRAARHYLEEIFPDKGAVYHFFLHMLEYCSGNLSASLREVQRAEDSVTEKESLSFRFQIMMNHGVCYGAMNNFHLADEYYRKAKALCDDPKILDHELLGTFYYNFAFNQLRLHPGTAEWKKALDECQAKLNMKKTDAKILMLNLKLELLRQTQAPREVIDQLLQETVSEITKCRLPLRKQVFFASSAVRVAWAARCNPIPCLNILKDNLSVIEGLPAEQRYHVYADLETLFRDLRGPADDPFADLRARTERYMNADAEADLRKWQAALPMEAVYARCDCLKKLAILSRKGTTYDRDRAISFQRNAIKLYHDNELYLEELHTHQDVIDELLDVRNRDEDLRPVCINEIREHLSAAEKLLSQLRGHPALVETYLRLGCYYLDVDDYAQSLKYTKLFRDTDISIQNFAPWLRRYYAMLLLQARVIMFDQAIKAAAADKQVLSLCKDIRDWFAAYPKHDGVLDTLLLGRFLAVPMRKTRVWIPKGEQEPQGHSWLWIPLLELNIDLTYPQFADDKLCRCMFFYKDRHPFESGTSLALQLGWQESSMRFEGVICDQIERILQPEAISLVESAYQFICEHLPEDCPSMEEITRLLQEVIVPVPIKA